MSTDHPTLAEVGEANIKGYLSREQMREKIRAELRDEIMHPSVWYPISKKNKERYDKLNNDFVKKEE
jgi:hypothetical protein